LETTILFDNWSVRGFLKELGDANQNGVDFLLTDLDLAMTFMV
jgi:hypothetical protein